MNTVVQSRTFKARIEAAERAMQAQFPTWEALLQGQP